MVGLKNLVIDEIKTLGESFILTGIKAKHKYESGSKTEELEGTYYSILCADRGYMTARVAVPGGAKIPMEEVAKNPKVMFDGLSIHVYFIDKRVIISVTATDVYVVKT